MVVPDIDDRTLLYTGGLRPTTPAGVTIGPATAHSRAGQVATLTAVNILARSHPALVLAVPDAPLIVDSPKGGISLVDACQRIALAARPALAVTVAHAMPDDVLAIGIGPDPGRAAIYAGGRRWTATTGTTPQPLDASESSLLGLGAAVTLATGWIFRKAIGLPAIAERGVSLWSLSAATEATGSAPLKPLDVGRVWMVGAGAVGSCLAWWLRLVGVTSPWTIIDRDVVDPTNLNRGLGLFADDVGEPGTPMYKSEVAAALVPGATEFVGWWRDWAARDEPSPDVILPLANDYGVRADIAAYSHPATLHATTSRNWGAELHRHLIGTDGCIACRFPEEAPVFECATGTVQRTPKDPGRDAALPFLSAAAGLVLTAALIQLSEGSWLGHSRNGWRLWFDDSATPLSSSRWHCTNGCLALSTPAVRGIVHGVTRWFSHDQADVSVDY